MLARDIVELILEKRSHQPQPNSAKAFAPTNIALIKYWGKRDAVLNLPRTDSLSISLAHKGTTTSLEITQSNQDEFWLNNELQPTDSAFSQRLTEFINLFRFNNEHYKIQSESNIPLAAGLASSAAGFASLIKAFNALYAWELDSAQLSILARLGSGSACRSIHNGFVWWQKGLLADGMDSYAVPLESTWNELCVGLLIFDKKPKAIGSREAMQRTVKTSYLFENWPQQVAHDLSAIHEAILTHDFKRLGEISEHNALSMHATMLSAWPPIVYSNIETLQAMNKIWELRKQGLNLYFTQDAGPNLKLLFLKQDHAAVLENFPGLEVVEVFSSQQA